MQFQINRDVLLKSLSIAHNIIERKNAKYSNIKVDNISIGIITPNKQIHKIEKKR